MTGNPLLRSDGIAEIRAVAGRISDVDDHVTVHQAADEIERLRAELVEERSASIQPTTPTRRTCRKWRCSRSGCSHDQ